ncbi:MAG: PCRF domain-containing protein, partial [Byssovorax sp.]
MFHSGSHRWQRGPRKFAAIFDEATLKAEIARLEQKMGAEDFWKDQEAAQRMLQRRKRLDGDLGLLARLRAQEDDSRVLVEWLEGGEDVEKDTGAALATLETLVEGAEFQKMLGGEHDRADAILTINAGEGGTDSQDWAEMLLRMYLRWCEKKGYKTSITEIQAGEEAGIKSATVLVQGEYAYGFLSAEVGVHRLVRIS